MMKIAESLALLRQSTQRAWQHEALSPMRFFWKHFISIMVIGLGAALVFAATLAPANIFHTILWVSLCISIFFAGFFCWGAAGARINMIAFLFLVMISNYSGLYYLTTGKPWAAYVYGGSWGAAALICFAWPMFRLVSNVDIEGTKRICAVLGVCMLAAVGSIYVPMKGHANGFLHRATDDAVKNEMEDVMARNGASQAIFAYQNRYLFNSHARANTSCSQAIKRFLAPILRPEELAMHATAAFWLQRVFVVSGLDIFGCWVSSYSAKPENEGLNRLVQSFEWAIRMLIVLPIITIIQILVGIRKRRKIFRA